MIGIRECGIGHPLELFLQDLGLIFGSRIEELMDGPVVAKQHGDKTVHKALDRRIGIEEPGYIKDVPWVLTIQGSTYLPAIEFGF